MDFGNFRKKISLISLKNKGEDLSFDNLLSLNNTTYPDLNKNHKIDVLEKRIAELQNEKNKNIKRETTASSSSTLTSSSRQNHRKPRNFQQNNSLPPTLAQYSFNGQPQTNPFQSSAQMILQQPMNNMNNNSSLGNFPNNNMQNFNGFPSNNFNNFNNNNAQLQKFLESQLKDTEDDDYGVDFRKNEKLLETIEKQSKLLENLASSINHEKDDKFSDERRFLEQRLKKLEKYSKNPSNYFQGPASNDPLAKPTTSNSYGFNSNSHMNPQNPYGNFPSLGPPGWMGSYPGMMTGMPPILPPGMGGFPGNMPGINGNMPGFNGNMPGLMGNMGGLMGNMGGNMGGLMGNRVNILNRHPELLKRLGLIKEGEDKSKCF